MKSKAVLIAVVCLLSLTQAQDLWGGESRKPRALVYALEGLGALGGAAYGGCGGVGGLLPLVLLFSWEGEVWPAVVGAAAGPGVAGLGAAWVGEQLGEEGSTGWAGVGAYIGTAVGVGIIALGAHVSEDDRWQRNGAVFVPACVLGGLCLPAGAVLGYNLGIPRESGSFQPGFGGRLQPPGVALTSVRSPDHSVEYGVKVQLAGLRF